MTEETKTDVGASDKAKLAASILLVLGGVVGYYVLAAQPAWQRWLAVAGGPRARASCVLHLVAVRAQFLAVRAGFAHRAAQDRVADAAGDRHDDRWSCSAS